MNIENLKSVIIMNCEKTFNEIKDYAKKNDCTFEIIQVKFRVMVLHQLTFEISAEYSYVLVYDLFLEIYYDIYYNKLLSYYDEVKK